VKEYLAEFQLRVVDMCFERGVSRVSHYTIHKLVSSSLKGTMAPAANDSDSSDLNVEMKSRGESPEQPGRSDQPNPAESDEGTEV
jgi:hypothetical protein